MNVESVGVLEASVNVGENDEPIVALSSPEDGQRD